MSRPCCLQIWASNAAVCVAALLAPSFALATPPQAPMSRAHADIDALLADHWRTAGVKPAAMADDSTLFRRLMLDLTGRVPTRQEAETFASDRSPQEKRHGIESARGFVAVPSTARPTQTANK